MWIKRVELIITVAGKQNRDLLYNTNSGMVQVPVIYMVQVHPQLRLLMWLEVENGCAKEWWYQWRWRWHGDGVVVVKCKEGRRSEQPMDVLWRKKKCKGRDPSLWCPVRPFVQQGRTKPGRRWAWPWLPTGNLTCHVQGWVQFKIIFILVRGPSPKVGQGIESQEGGRSFRKRVLTQSHLHFKEKECVYLYVFSTSNKS